MSSEIFESKKRTIVVRFRRVLCGTGLSCMLSSKCQGCLLCSWDNEKWPPQIQNTTSRWQCHCVENLCLKQSRKTQKPKGPNISNLKLVVLWWWCHCPETLERQEEKVCSIFPKAKILPSLCLYQPTLFLSCIPVVEAVCTSVLVAFWGGFL